MRVIAAKRERLAGELVPVSAEQSATFRDDEEMFGAANAVDLELDNYSFPEPGSDGATWLKLTLDQVHCVEQVVWIDYDGSPFITWTCSDGDCSTCEGEGEECSVFLLTVYTEGASLSDSQCGDTLKIEKIKSGDYVFSEIVIIVQGSVFFHARFW